jgi:predicted RNA-binding protein YlxR (DUF448 family)/ribosomal protein L30E
VRAEPDPSASVEGGAGESDGTRGDPRRTCVGCRRTDDRAALLRFVLVPAGLDAAGGAREAGRSPRGEAARVVPDVRGTLPGRGASVHPTRACLQAAARRGGFARSFRAPVDVDADALVRNVATTYARQAEALLLTARRMGRLVAGTDAVREKLDAGRVAALVVAADAAGRREELEERAARLGRRCIVLGTKERLGALLGRDPVGVIAILDPGIVDALARAAARARSLSEAE